MPSHETRGAVWRGLFLTLVLELMLVPAILYWPNFEANVGKLKSLTPLPVLKQLVTSLEEGGVFAYVAGQHFFKAAPGRLADLFGTGLLTHALVDLVENAVVIGVVFGFGQELFVQIEAFVIPFGHRFFYKKSL